MQSSPALRIEALRRSHRSGQRRYRKPGQRPSFEPGQQPFIVPCERASLEAGQPERIRLLPSCGDSYRT